MKSTKMVISLVTVVLVMLMTGCASTANAEEESSGRALSIVVGSHKCSKELNLTSPLVMDAVSDTIEKYGFVSVVSCDGSPDLIAADNYDIPEQYKGAAESKLKADAENKSKNLMLRISEVKADDSEVDTLESLRLAVRSFSSAPKDCSKRIIVIDTGWSTTGLLDFNNNLINGSPDAIAASLFDKDAIPDFSGVTVEWAQMGDVAEPQSTLSPAQRNRLRDIWRAIIEKGGGCFKSSDTVPNNGTIGGDLPDVSPVTIPEEEPIEVDAKIESTSSRDLFETPISFSEEKIQFKGDSSEYVDVSKAKKCIKPIAKYMKQYPKFKLLLLGTTAGDKDSEYVRRLSYERARAVKKTLEKLGIYGGRISLLGLGNENDPYHVFGVGTSGKLASQNRKVVMMDASSAEAVKLQEKWKGAVME